MAPPNRFRTWCQRALALAAGSIVGLALVELALRLVGISFPLPYVPDEYCGSRLRPGMVADFTVEGRARVSITSDGRRDRERGVAKPPGTLRIAVLGDSFVEALQVPLEETFGAVLERQLAQCEALRGRNVEVLNFGVSGFSTAQELEMLRHYVWRYEPDIVLLAFFAGNDVRDNSRRLSPDGVRPYYSLAGDELVLDQSFREHPFYLDARTGFSRFKVQWINRLRLLQVARELWARRGAAARPAVTAPASLEAGLDPVYGPPPNDAWREAWAITERLLVRMRDEVESHDAEFWVVTLSTGLQVHPDPKVRQAALQRMNSTDEFYVEQRLEELGRREPLKVLALAPALQRQAEEQKEFLHGFASSGSLGVGHWNARGHALAGQRIAAALCAALEATPSGALRHRQENVGQKNRIPRTGQLPQPK